MKSSTLAEPVLFESGFAAQPDRVVYNYFAYPGSLRLLPCGKLTAVFVAKKMQGPDECLRIDSTDGGLTWSSPETLFGGPVISDSQQALDESYGDPVLVVVDEKRVMALAISSRYTPESATTKDISRSYLWRRISDDGGETFGPIEQLPGYKNYHAGLVHHGLRLQNYDLLLGYSWDRSAEGEVAAGREGEMHLLSGALISSDEGQTWSPGQDVDVTAGRGAVHYEDSGGGIAEPAIVELPDGRLFMLGRTPTNNLWQSYSHDGGRSWETPTASPLVSHNCPAALLRLEEDGAILAIYNNDPLRRARLSASLSTDGCQTWSEPRPLAPMEHFDIPEASYPAPCELPDGTIVVVFGQISSQEPECIFNIHFVRFNRAYLQA